MSHSSCSREETATRSKLFSEWYPPDYDHGGKPLLGPNTGAWDRLLDDVVFLNAACSQGGNVILVVGRIEGGFVEVRGQYVQQGEALDPDIVRSLRTASFRIPVSGEASTTLGLEIELDQPASRFDWRAAARRMEIDLLSTIARIANLGSSTVPPDIPRAVR